MASETELFYVVLLTLLTLIIHLILFGETLSRRQAFSPVAQRRPEANRNPRVGDPLSARGKILDRVRGKIDAESDPGNCNGTESDAGKPSEPRFEAPQPTARYCFAGSIQVAFVPLHRSINP